LGGFFALILLAVGAFAWLYFRLVDVPRVVVHHVPVGARFAARIDLAQIALFAPIRKHVLPVLLEREGRPLDEKTELERLERATGVNVGMDVFELLLVERDSALGFVIGGRLPERGVVEGFFGYLGVDGSHGCSLRGPRLCCARPTVCVEQATDGAVVGATEPQLLEAMLPSGDAYAALGITPEGPGSFGLRVPELGAAGFGVLGAAVSSSGLGALERIEGHLVLAEEVRLRFEGVPRPGASLADWPEKLETLRDALAASLFAPGRDLGGERAVLARLRFGRAGDRVTAEATWQPHEIDQAARSLGAICGAWLGASRNAP
jgi:hypothetical protein